MKKWVNYYAATSGDTCISSLIYSKGLCTLWLLHRKCCLQTLKQKWGDVPEYGFWCCKLTHHCWTLRLDRFSWVWKPTLLEIWGEHAGDWCHSEVGEISFVSPSWVAWYRYQKPWFQGLEVLVSSVFRICRNILIQFDILVQMYLVRKIF
jgi:hypothetical protein